MFKDMVNVAQTDSFIATLIPRSSFQIATEHGGKGRLKQVARQPVHGKEHDHQHQHRHATDTGYEDSSDDEE